MSKKNVLNEVRRFMKLANLDASLSSNFVGKLEEMEHAYKRDEEEEMMQEEEEAEEMEAELEMPEEDEEAEEEAMDDMDDMGMMDMEDEEEEADEEADEAVLTDDEADAIIALADKLRAARDEDAGDEEMEMEMDAEEMMQEEEQTIEEILDDVLSEEEETTTLEEEEETTLEEEATEDTGAQINEEELVQEVLRRVKARLASMSKE